MRLQDVRIVQSKKELYNRKLSLYCVDLPVWQGFHAALEAPALGALTPFLRWWSSPVGLLIHHQFPPMLRLWFQHCIS